MRILEESKQFLPVFWIGDDVVIGRECLWVDRLRNVHRVEGEDDIFLLWRSAARVALSSGEEVSGGGGGRRREDDGRYALMSSSLWRATRWFIRQGRVAMDG